MIPHLVLKKKKKTETPPNPQPPGTGGRTEKDKRTTVDAPRRSVGQHKAIETIGSNPGSFTLSSPTGQEPPMGSPRGWTGGPGKKPAVPPLSFTLSATVHTDTQAPRMPLTSRREKPAETLQRLLGTGLVAASEAGLGEPGFKISDLADEHDLFKACSSWSLPDPEAFGTACAFLDAALPLIRNAELREQLLHRYTPTFLQHHPTQWPDDRWPNLCNAIQCHRIATELDTLQPAIDALGRQEKPKRDTGASLLQQLHGLLTQATQAGELDLAKRVVAMAQQLALSYEAAYGKLARDPGAAPVDLSRITVPADALYAEWQQAMLASFASPGFLALFEEPIADHPAQPDAIDPAERPSPLVRMHGSGAQTRFSFPRPAALGRLVQAIAEVCQQWCLRGCAAEADRLLDALMNVPQDPAFYRQLVGELSGDLIALLARSDRASALTVAGMLLKLHRFSPLPPAQVESLANLLGAFFSESRYDFEGMRRLNAVADRLDAIDAHRTALSPDLQRRCAELRSACRDALGRLHQFNDRWKLSVAQGRVLSVQYQPGRVKDDPNQLRQEAVRLEQVEKDLKGQTHKLVQQAPLLPNDKRKKKEEALLLKKNDFQNQRAALWKKQEEYGGQHAYEREMFIADINRFLEDPWGPPWHQVTEAIDSASAALQWTPSAAQWLSWAILAAGRKEMAPLEQAILQLQQNSNLQTARDTLFDCLRQLMDRHLPWHIVQAAMDTVHMSRGWQLSAEQKAVLCLAQAQRGDTAPLVALLGQEPSLRLSVGDLHQLLSLFDLPQLPPERMRLLRQIQPLFKHAPEELRSAYQALVSAHEWRSSDNPSLEHRRSAVPARVLPPFNPDPAPGDNALQARSGSTVRAPRVPMSPRRPHGISTTTTPPLGNANAGAPTARTHQDEQRQRALDRLIAQAARDKTLEPLLDALAQAGGLSGDSLTRLLDLVRRGVGSTQARLALLEQLMANLPPGDARDDSLHTAFVMALFSLPDMSTRERVFQQYLGLHAKDGGDEAMAMFTLVSLHREQPPTQLLALLRNVPRPGSALSWATWRALCRMLLAQGSGLVLQSQQASKTTQATPETRALILDTLSNLATTPQGDAALAALHLFDLLDDWRQAWPEDQRKALLQQLHEASLQWSGPPALQAAMRGALQLLVALQGGPQPLSLPATQNPAMDEAARLFARLFAARRAAHHRGSTGARVDLSGLQAQVAQSSLQTDAPDIAQVIATAFRHQQAAL